MSFFLRNTLTNRREEFVPRDPARPTMYVCGPTVYGPAHVGNARPAAVFDLTARVLKSLWPGTVYARNITDIDDKIIAAAGTEGVSALALRCADEYRAEMSALNIAPPDFEPLATAHIPEMLDMISRLLEKGFAYQAEGHVLFHSAGFSDYGALSNRNRDEMIAGARVEVAPYKRDPADFVLWKPSPDDMPGWDSPWGRGRPGWHLECSAMAEKCLGLEIDLHGGGQDLIFPHHENEIAQSRCAHGTQSLARYWMHNGHVSADGEKMSKSLGNVFLTRDALAEFPGEAVRWALLSAHYRRPLRWSETLLRESRAALDRLYEALRGAEKICAAGRGGRAGGAAAGGCFFRAVRRPEHPDGAGGAAFGGDGVESRACRRRRRIGADAAAGVAGGGAFYGIFDRVTGGLDACGRRGFLGGRRGGAAGCGAGGGAGAAGFCGGGRDSRGVDGAGD